MMWWWVWVLSLAIGAPILVPQDGDPVVIGIRKDTGVILVFPEPVKLATPSPVVQLESLEGASPEIRFMRARWIGASRGGPASDVVVFALSSGRSIPIEFLPLPGAPTYAELRLADEVIPSPASNAAEALSRALDLVGRMVEAGPSQPAETVTWTDGNGGRQLRWRLTRRFAEPGLEGLELQVQNRSRRTVVVEPWRIVVGEDSDVLAVQIDDDGVPAGGTTIVRLVRRTPGGETGRPLGPLRLP